MGAVCHSCGFQNPPEMRFCGNCGTRLSLPIENEGSEHPVNATYVGNTHTTVDPAMLGVMTGTDLLERFRRAGLEARGQRRSVTVLFVDLSGFTQLSEELGDEALYELVQRFISVLVADVYRYEGMVDKLTGDGLMALFGAPIAYENNAERALRSALDMLVDVEHLSQKLDLQGHSLRIHVGLNAGSVIVGGLGGDGLMNYTAIGDSVNLARRLEEAAGTGTILVSESVYRQTTRLFDFTPLSPLNLKNVSRPVPAYQVVGPKARPGSVRGVEGLRAPMIGRESELRQVQQMIERLVHNHQGGVVLLVGEGGMGKSRLTSELKSGLDHMRLRVLEGHSLTYRKAIAYWIFQDVLRGWLGVTTETGEAEVRQRLAGQVVRTLGNAGPEKLSYLEHILSLEPSDPEDAVRLRYLTAGQMRQQIFLAMRDLLLALAHQRPLLLILEDLHWADDASLELIRFLLESTRGASLLIYAISRPFEGGAVQVIHEQARQRLGERYLFLLLKALPPAQSEQLLQALLTIQDLPEALRTQIIQRSAGLPFYLEEILRMLIENNVLYFEHDSRSSGGYWRSSPGAEASAAGVPETLQGLILTRFDRLSSMERRLLQVASVIGYQFNGQVLLQVTSDYLREDSTGSMQPDVSTLRTMLSFLVEREFITRLSKEGYSSLPGGDEEYAFRHVLVSDAVYSTLLQRDRRDLHTRVGQAIEQIYAGRLEGQIEVLAGHFLRSPLLDRALHYLTLAGKKSASSYANEQARLHFTQALELLGQVVHTPHQAFEVYLGLGDVLLTGGDYPAAREYFRQGFEALGSCEQTGASCDDLLIKDTGENCKKQTSLLQRKIAQTHESQGDYEKALICLREAKALLQNVQAGCQAEQASILSDTGWIHFRRGELDHAERMLRQALELAESAGQPDVLASVLNRLAGIYFQRDLPDQASGFLARSLVLRERIGDVVGVARSFNNLGLLGWKQGDLVSALENFNHSYELQSNLGDVEGMVVLHNNMGLIELDLGDWSEAERHFQEALESSAQIGHVFHVCEARMHLALLKVMEGDWHKALEHGHLGLVGFQELGVKENLFNLHVSMGWAYLGLEDWDRLEETLVHIYDMLAEDGVVPLESEGRAYRLLGSVEHARGDMPGAQRALLRSAEVFAQVGNPIERARVLVDMAGQQAAGGCLEEAQQAFDEARRVFTRMGARLELQRLTQVEQQTRL